MKTASKKLFCMLLVAVMLFSVIPFQAFASETDEATAEVTETPTTEAPTTEATTEATTKATEAPTTEATTKATEAPATEAPTTEATEATTKETEAPTTESGSGSSSSSGSTSSGGTKYSVTFDAGKGTLTDSGASSMTKTYKSGTQIGTLPKVTAPKNKKFKGWYYNNTKLGGSGAASSQTVTGDMTITAMYVDLEYQLVIKITKNNNYDTAIHFATDNVTAGQNLLKLLNNTYAQSVMDATPKGYKMEKSGDVPKWRYYDTGKEILESDETTNTTQNVYVNCTARTYTISFDSKGGSKCDDIKVTYGKTVGTLPTPTRKGYVFVGWYYPDTSSKDNKYTKSTKFTETKNITLIAKWEDEAKVILNVYVNGDTSSPEMWLVLDGYISNKNVTLEKVKSLLSSKFTGSLTFQGLYDDATWKTYVKNTSKAGALSVQVLDDSSNHLTNVYVMVKGATGVRLGSGSSSSSGSTNNSDNPKTGDNTQIAAAATLMVVAAAAVVTFETIRRKKRI